MTKTVFISLPIEDLQTVIIDCVNSCLKNNKEESKTHTNQTEQWFALNELIKYDPEKRTKPTWYSKISKGEIPYHKRGKKVYFLKSEIDNWLKSGKQKSRKEIEAEAEDYLFNKKRLK